MKTPHAVVLSSLDSLTREISTIEEGITKCSHMMLLFDQLRLQLCDIREHVEDVTRQIEELEAESSERNYGSSVTSS